MPGLPARGNPPIPPFFSWTRWTEWARWTRWTRTMVDLGPLMSLACCPLCDDGDEDCSNAFLVETTEHLEELSRAVLKAHSGQILNGQGTGEFFAMQCGKRLFQRLSGEVCQSFSCSQHALSLVLISKLVHGHNFRFEFGHPP